MKKLAIAAMLLLCVVLPVQALSTSDILSLVAMPLAVAAVSNLNGVPQNQLANLLSTLNQANVPPTEFVQVVRYVPVALVAQPTVQPTFVDYVNQQYSQGITGPQLVTVMDQRLATNYGVTPVIVPNRVVYVDDSYIPQTVVTQIYPAYADPTALVAMPLAVAAISEMAGVPQNQFADLVATLNAANVPPVQFIDTVQYAPVALVAQPVNQPLFVDFVQTQVQQGITGPALVTVIDRQLPVYGVTSINPTPVVVAPGTIAGRENFPTGRAGGNPFGGPPGQIKKQLGLQTGAEVVHGFKPGRQFAQQPVVVTRVEHGHGNGRGHGRGNPHNVAAPVIVTQPDEHGHGNGHGHGNPHERGMVMQTPPMSSAAPPVAVPAAPGPPGGVPPGQAKKEGGGEPGKGNGKEKGHGKD
jgi:hypothetical protein